LVLGLDRELQRRALVEVYSLPQPLEEIESELAPERFLDHLAVALAEPRRPDLDCPKHIFVDRQGRPHLRHLCIIASRCRRPRRGPAGAGFDRDRCSAASNVEIAQAVFLSRKTVERHLTNVFAKVGVRNRTELAARLAPPTSS
jgi:hypothetical protein